MRFNVVFRDFHKLILTVLKASFHKIKPCEILYSNYKNFNSVSFNEDVTKALRKAIMRRSKLEKIYFKKQTNESLKAYKKQKIIKASVIKKKEKNYLTISIHLLYPIIRIFGK